MPNVLQEPPLIVSSNCKHMKSYLSLILTLLIMGSRAQTVNNTLHFQKGQKLVLVAQAKSVISQEIMGQSIDMNINSTVTRHFDIEDVKQNTATIEHKVKRIQFSFDAMGQIQQFDSEKEEDLKSEMGKSVQKSLKNKYTMTVDPYGSIVSVKADDDNPNKPEEINTEDVMGSLMAQFAEGLEMPRPGDASEFKILPVGEINKGFTWTDTLSSGETGTVRYTVSDITTADILVDYNAEGTMERQQESMGMATTIRLKNLTSGKIIIDRQSGLLKEKTASILGTGTVDLAGQSIPMKSKVEIGIVVKGR